MKQRSPQEATRRSSNLGNRQMFLLVVAVATIFFTISTLGAHQGLLGSSLSDADNMALLASIQTNSSLRGRMDKLELRWQKTIDELSTTQKTADASLRAEMQNLTQTLQQLVSDQQRLSTELQELRSLRDSSIAPSKFAYTFVIGGCNPKEKGYRNYFYNILVATKTLREHGSRSDVVVFVQMAYKYKGDVIPEEDARWFDAMGIHIRYIPKDPHESFYSIMLEKFRILTLTEYDRVIFMDGDVLPRTNLDYIFEKSMSGVFRENLVLAGSVEPASGGFFMLKPSPGDFELVQQIIHDSHVRGMALPYPHWDDEVGWGHKIEAPDYYDQLKDKSGTLWNFYGSHADQGLLYHWVKYVKKSVTVVLGGSTVDWIPHPNGTMHRVEGLSNLDELVQGERISCWAMQNNFRKCRPPHSDFMHFTGKKKPWILGPPVNLTEGSASFKEESRRFWFSELAAVNRTLGMGLNFSAWDRDQVPSLGFIPARKDLMDAVNRKRETHVTENATDSESAAQ